MSRFCALDHTVCVAEDVQFREAGVFNQDLMILGISFFQDPSVASVTNNAARGLEDFNPFEDQNKSQGSGSKVCHFLRACVSLRMVFIQSCIFRGDSRPKHCNIVERF